MTDLLQHLDLNHRSARAEKVPDRRSLAYRLNMVLNTVQIGFLHGGDRAPESHRPVQASFVARLAQECGARISGEELQEIREGRQLHADTRELKFVAQVLGIPGWVLTQTPPPGQRVAMALGPEHWRATLVGDDGGATLAHPAVSELTEWIKEGFSAETAEDSPLLEILRLMSRPASSGGRLQAASADPGTGFGNSSQDPAQFAVDIIDVVRRHVPHILTGSTEAASD